MTYVHVIESCFEDAIGRVGVPRRQFTAQLSRTGAILAELRARHDDGSLPLLRLPARHDDLAAAASVAEHLLKNTTDLFVFGTGGSSLGAQAIAAIAGLTPGLFGRQGGARVHFLDNLDPVTLDAAFAACDLRTTRFLVVSKSGTTAETLLQTLAAMGRIQAAGGGKYMKAHFAAITEPGDNPLRRLAGRHGFPVLDHDPLVGGRFSVLSVVGLLPALLLGLDAAALRAGAAEVLAPVLAGAAPETVPAAAGAALAVAAGGCGISQMVMMPYADRLERFAMWYRQLWAESLGKDGKGTTPIRALGPVDQHSQLQLYLDGPRDKLFTILQPSLRGLGSRIEASVADDPALAPYVGKTIGDLVAVEARATAETLARHGCPVRVIRLEAVAERTLGALFMHFMLETMIAARLLGVDAFDQPAVEEGKVLARRYLADGVG
ncbi:MAG: glucose-6-phosphate isomerase [Alphaproteobacteria bacterium]|nr:glucose-6-phosphate isomerase [Alphaproteobacteria bacterium]